MIGVSTVVDATHEQAIRQVRESLNRMRGRLFEAIESFGLPACQESAAKNVVRRMTYELQADLEATLRKDH